MQNTELQELKKTVIWKYELLSTIGIEKTVVNIPDSKPLYTITLYCSPIALTFTKQGLYLNMVVTIWKLNITWGISLSEHRKRST